MSQRRAVAFAAAGGTLLATAPLATVFQDWTWVVYAVLVVAAVSGAGIGSRALRAQPWVQLLAMLAALLIMLTWLAHGPGAIAGTIPTRSTFVAFGQLLAGAGDDIRKSGLPIPGDPALLFLVGLGIGLVMVLVDLLAVPLRRPAIAGFPMLAIYAVPVFVHQDSVAALPFAVGAAGFLWLLGSDSVERVRRFGRRFTGEGRGVDLWEPSPLAAAGRRLALFGVVLAVALPVAIPGMTTGFFDRFDTGAGDGLGPGDGRGNSVNLFATLEGQLHQSKAFEMLRVTTNDPAPYYMRFATADELTPQGFRPRPLGSNQAITDGGIPDANLDLPGASQRLFHATVTAVDFDMRYLPAYRILSNTQKLDKTWLYDGIGDQVYSLRSSTKGRTYSFDYAATTYDPAELRKAVLDPTSSVREFTKVSEQQKEVVTLVDGLIAGKSNDYDRVMAIYTYFTVANHFQYSLSTKPGTSGSDIVNFLKQKQGYCEQYAAAMAWMVRTANIPARVAFGFTRGTRIGSSYSLTNLNLHAWTEVYFSGFGWVPFDATPTLPGTVISNWAPDPNRPLTGPSSSPGVNGANPSGGPGGDVPTPPHRNGIDRPGDSAALAADSTRQTWFWWGGAAGVLVLLLLLVPGVRRSSLRRQRLRSRDRPAGEVAVDDDTGPPGEMRIVAAPAVVIRDAHAAWAEFVDTLVDYGFPPDEARTPRETVRALAGELRIGGSTAEALRLLARAEERARYARTPLDVGNLGGALRAIRAAVKARASRRTRLRAAILPPSVIQRWSYRTSTAGTILIGALGRNWEGAVRVLSPRRLLPGRTNR
jgi:hypothetical protein